MDQGLYYETIIAANSKYIFEKWLRVYFIGCTALFVTTDVQQSQGMNINSKSEALKNFFLSCWLKILAVKAYKIV